MIKIDIRSNFPDVARAFKTLPREVADKALVRALNRTVESGRTDMAREIAGEFVLSVSDAKARIVIRRASVRRGSIRFQASLEVPPRGKGRSLNVIRFLETRVSLAEARRRAKSGTLADLRFRFKRRGGPKRIPGTFIGNKGRTVFRRVGKDRLPIQAVSTIDVGQMFNTRKINEAVRRAMLDRFEEVFAREASYYLSRWGGR